jgi:hypothetical protein
MMRARIKLILLINLIVLIIFAIQSSSTVEASNKYNFHPECGESPTQKYKELAKAIGIVFLFYSYVFI